MATDANPPTIEPGASFGPYRVLRSVGSGGMGAVFEGHHDLLSRRVAIKVMHAKHAERADSRERFVREARSVARLQHPHVVQIFDVGILGDQPYIVMEFLEGESLEAALARMPVCDATKATAILLPIASALLAVHRAGLVHRDVKPENIFLALDAKGHVVPKLVDFGIAKDLGTAVMGSHHTVVGTPHYMSPEQARGSLTLDARTDQYAFAVMLYQVVTGRMPFDADSLIDLVRAIDAGNAVDPRVHEPTLDPAFAELVMRGMRRNAEDRFPSMRELGREMLAFASPRLAAQHGSTFVDDVAPLSEVQTGPIPTRDRAFYESVTTSLDEFLEAPRATGALPTPSHEAPLAPPASTPPVRRGGRAVLAIAVAAALAAMVGMGWRVLRTPGESENAQAVRAAGVAPGASPPAPLVGATTSGAAPAPVAAAAPPSSATPNGPAAAPTADQPAEAQPEARAPIRRTSAMQSAPTRAPSTSGGASPNLDIRLER